MVAFVCLLSISITQFFLNHKPLDWLEMYVVPVFVRTDGTEDRTSDGCSVPPQWVT